VGVDCAKGLNPIWMHFVPKLLKLGGALLVAHSLCFLHVIHSCALLSFGVLAHC